MEKIPLIQAVRGYGQRIYDLRFSINPWDIEERLNIIRDDHHELCDNGIDSQALADFVGQCSDRMRTYENMLRRVYVGAAFVGLKEAKDFVESQIAQFKVEFVTHTYDNDPLPRHAFNSVEEAMKCIAENQRVGTYHIRNGFNRNENGLGDLLATITIE